MPPVRALFVGVLALFTAQCGDPGTAPKPITALPRALTDAENRLVDADNRFAFKLFRELAQQSDPDSSLFLSPLSVATALAMTYNGAAGTTEQEMAAALELQGFTLADVNASYRGLIDLLRGLDRQVTFEIANSIWYRAGWTFEQPFLDANRTYFDATVQALDFASPTAAPTINGWVSNRTHGRIPTIVPDPVPSDVIMYLINAIYFKGSWTQQFATSLTRAAPFHLRDGSTATVQMMAHDEPADVRVHYAAGVTVLDLPYGGGPFTMTIVLPGDPAGIDGLVAGLTAEQWYAWMAGLDSASLEVRLPKFRFGYKANLNDVLGALGMPRAFCSSGGPTDFTRMRAAADACLTDVLHKAWVDVNEEGTEAAAATAVGVGVTSAPQPIVVDRPFLFAIRENLSGTILFLGRMLRPEAG